MADVNNPKVQKILQSKAFAHLATLGSNGEPQSSPMWFLWDGEYIKFTHTTNRKKYQNIQRDPRVSISITDLDVPYTYAEFRGVIGELQRQLVAEYALESRIVLDQFGVEELTARKASFENHRL